MKLLVEYSTEKDAETYINFIRNFKSYKHGRDDIQDRLLSKLEKPLQDILINSENDEIALEKVTEYLKTQYEKNPSEIDNSINKFKTSWDEIGDNLIYSLEFLYKKPFPFDVITMYITTNSIFPYDYEQRYFFSTYKYLSMQIGTLLHELNHFMFFYYYPQKNFNLDSENYALLKESLTFFSNPNEAGKPNEKALRDFYKSKVWNSLDEAISAGTSFLLKKE